MPRIVVSSGTVSSGTVVTAKDTIQVDSGGTLLSAILLGGTENLFGTDANTVVSSGGQAFVLSGGTATATVIASGGSGFVLSGGLALQTEVSAGGQRHHLRRG